MRSKVRRQINTGGLDYESLSPEIRSFREIFLGEICGVMLYNRGKNDPHVCFEIITEDDGHWFPYTGNGASSYWFSDYENVLRAAREWCEENCDPDIKHDIQYGWKFREG